MNVPPTLYPIATASASRAAGPLRGIGKSNASQTFDGECGGDDDVRGTSFADGRSAAAAQFGTSGVAPLWNGPRLRPAFVAQVLGQVMMDDRATALSLAPAAYRERGAQIPPGVLFLGEV